MKIDFEHWRGAEIGQQIMSNLQELVALQSIEHLKPVFSIDGNQYCYLYGTMPDCYVAGFGDTPMQAALRFHSNFQSSIINQKERVR